MYKYVIKVLMEINFQYQPDTKLHGYLYTSPLSPCGENVLKVSVYYLRICDRNVTKKVSI